MKNITYKEMLEGGYGISHLGDDFKELSKRIEKENTLYELSDGRGMQIFVVCAFLLLLGFMAILNLEFYVKITFSVFTGILLFLAYFLLKVEIKKNKEEMNEIKNSIDYKLHLYEQINKKILHFEEINLTDSALYQNYIFAKELVKNELKNRDN